MRVAIVSDIHSNLVAFEAVAQDFGQVDEVWCIGDIVGYGPEPNECIDLLKGFKHYAVAGNHDWGAVGKISLDDFNLDARLACEWTATQLTEASRRYLAELPTRLEMGDFTLAHGSPRDPIWEYLLSPLDAQASFHAFTAKYCLIGHSHFPLIFSYLWKDGKEHCQGFAIDPDFAIKLTETRLIINSGSVGQPRDGNPEAAYALLDTERNTLVFRRVPYDIRRTQERMSHLGLPEYLAARLSIGR